MAVVVKAERVVEFPVGEQSRVGGDHRSAKLEHQAAVEIQSKNLATRFTRPGGKRDARLLGGVQAFRPRTPQGPGFQVAVVISPVSGSAAAAASSAGRGSRRRLAFDCLSR
jgi:hypothetical protein